jgi:pimeloyl-ACP methyl ester carboxylesterase
MAMRTLLLFFFSLMVSCGDTTDAPTGNTGARFLNAEPVEFTTSDGFLLRGTFFYNPSDAQPKPAIVLLHSFGGSHLDWFAFAPDLVDLKHFVVLAIDLRGHGASRFQNGLEFPIETFSPDDLNNMPLDLVASVAYLKTRPEAIATRIGMLGVDVGANLAFIGSGTLPEVQAAVSISPQFRENQAQGILTGTNLPGFQPSNVLFVASFGDGYAYTSSQTMAGLTGGLTQILGLQGVAHGMDVLGVDDTWESVMDWFSQTLANS